MKTMIVIGNPLEFPNINKPADMFSAEEIDHLESGMLIGLGERELVGLKQKLSDTFDWLEAGTGKTGIPDGKYGKNGWTA